MKRIACLAVLAAFAATLGAGCDNKKAITPTATVEAPKVDPVVKDERGSKKLPDPPKEP